MLAMRFDDPRLKSKLLGPGDASALLSRRASSLFYAPRKCESRLSLEAKLAECTELIGGVCDLALGEKGSGSASPMVR